jgi:hypothetical protein
MLIFWLGFMTALWVFTVLGVAYVVFKYVYQPWLRVHTNFVEVAKKFSEYEAKFKEYDEGLRFKRMCESLTDEELARIERASQARAASRLRNS